MFKIITKIKFIHVFWFFFYLLILVMLVKGGFSQLDPDFGWHFKVGQEIAVNHQIPHANIYNYTYTGDWVDHEWLSNLLIYIISDNLGYATLVGLFAGLILLTLIILNIFTYKTVKNSYFWLIAIIQLFGVVASMPHFGVRIQEFALLFVLLILIIIEFYRRFNNWRVLLFLPPLFFFWANIHASFLIGFFILFSWVAVKLFENLITRYKKLELIIFEKSVPLKSLAVFVGFSIISLLVTLVTPYKLELYSFLSGYKNKAYLSLIQEWLPQYSFPFHYDQLLYLALGTTALIIYIYLQIKNKKIFNTWIVFLTFIFLILSFQSRRHFPLFFIVSFGLVIEVYNQIFIGIKLAYYYWLKWLLAVCLVLVIVSQFLAVNVVSRPLAAFCSSYPCGAIDFLKNNPQYNDDNLFNNYGWGGFLIWALPERKLFIDGRLPQVEFAGWTFIQEYFDFFDKNDKSKNKLNQYNIKLVLLKSKDEPIKVKKWERIFFNINDEILIPSNRLRDYLDLSDEWRIIYQDETAKIYFKD